MLYRAIAAAVLALPCVAHACDRVDVAVLPFEPRYDHSVPFSTLSADGVPTFGVTTVTTTARVQGCQVVVGYADPVVHVAAELRRDSCAFEHVLGHEDEHVRIYRDALATLAARIQARRGEANLFAAVVQELDAVKPQHRAHDSDAEYHTNETACSGRILRLAGLRHR